MNPNDPMEEGSGEGQQNPYSSEQSPYPRPDMGGGGMMGPRKVDFAVIGEAFNVMSTNFVPMLIAGLICVVPFAISMIIGFPMIMAGAFAGMSGDPAAAAAVGIGGQLIGSLILMVGGAIASIGIYGGARIAVAHRRGEPITNDLAMSGFKRAIPIVIFGLLQGILISIAGYCCCFPALIVGGLIYPGFAVLAEDESAGIGDAFTKSIEVMKPQIWMAAALFLVTYLIGYVGSIVLGIGLALMGTIMALAYMDMAYGPGGVDRRVAGQNPPTA